jgi:hypothetical protein
MTLKPPTDAETGMLNRAPRRNHCTGTFWRSEAPLNWLALGLLLAAWNATDNDAATTTAAAPDTAATARQKPRALRGYPYVSVRAVNRVTAGRVGRQGNVTEL